MMHESFIGSNLDVKSVDSKKESADTLSDRDSEKLNVDQKKRVLECRNHETFEEQEHINADIEFEKDIEELERKVITLDDLDSYIELNYSGNKKSFDTAKDYIGLQNMTGNKVFESELKKILDSHIEEKKELSTAEKIKNYKEQLTQQGKSSTEILQTLISKFKNEEAVSTWVENWKNYLKLHQLSETKSPRERRAIQNIIAKADFTNENSFENSLTEISNSTELSAQTKFEISKEFDGQNISSVSGMDSALNQIKSRKSEIEQAIDGKSQEKDSLQSEITDLENELEALSPDDPKSRRVEKEISRKKGDLGTN